MALHALLRQSDTHPPGLVRDRLLEQFRAVAPCGPPDIAAVFLPLLTPEDPHGVFRKYAGSSYTVEQARSQGIAIHTVTKTIRSGPQAERTASCSFASFQIGETWLLGMTREDLLAGKNLSDVIRNCLCDWVDMFYPSLSRLEFTEKQLRHHLTSLNTATSEAIVLRSIMRYPGKGYLSAEHEESLADTFQRLDKEGGFLDRVTYESRCSDGQYAATVARDGIAHYHRGSFDLFLGDLDRLIRQSLADLETYDMPEAAPAEGTLTGVELDFGARPLLSDIEDTESFVEALESDPALVVVVLHGNPYLHLEVIDCQDGSTFSVFSREGLKARILPGPGSSSVSLKRMAGCIRRNFAECQQERVTIKV